MNVREIAIDGEEWVVWPSGGGAYGTGALGLGNVEAIHFAHASAPAVPVLEALLAAHTFYELFDDELIAIFRQARRVVDPAELGDRGATRRPRSLQ
jgi:hypothetical protein